jgi:tetratricopeptide (TPR) repeat protein
MGLAYYFKGDYVASIEKFQESLKTYEDIKDETGVANILNNMAAIYGEQGNEEKGLEYSLRSLSISEKLGNKLRILSALNTIGSIYFNKEDTKDKALEFLLRALPLCEEINDSSAIGTISENIGEIYQDKDSFAKAISYFEKSIKALGNTANSSFAYNGIGKVYEKLGKYDEALRYHNKGLQIAQDLGSKPNMVRSLYGLGKTYFLKREYPASIKYYQQAVQ